MASSSTGTSSGFTPVQNSGSESGLQQIMDQRKRKRMLSNRESARRSRMRKQKHLDDLMAQASQLREENNQIISNISPTSQLYMNIEAENSVLRAQMAELTHRLQSLNEIIDFLNSTSGSNHNNNKGVLEIEDDHMMGGDDFLNPWNLLYVNQPIVAYPDVFLY